MDASDNDIEAFEERAAILEYDAGMPRLEAEIEARRLLSAAISKDREFKILSIAMGIAGMKLKRDRDAALLNIKARYNPATYDAVVIKAKEIYAAKKGGG